MDRDAPFPPSRFIDHNAFHYYYAYANTPPEDLLEHVTGAASPSVLMLGCGDIRSCFYTLWKNFDASYGRSCFSGVSFVLNDCSSAVLARDVLLLYLVMKLPSNQKSSFLVKEWLSAMWAIWYCHELWPNHVRVLKDALSVLVEWSQNTDTWQSSKGNPLGSFVDFVTAETLQKVHNTWKEWAKKDLDSAMRILSERKQLLSQVSNGNAEAYIDLLGTADLTDFFGLLVGCSSTPAKITAMLQEHASYLRTGSAHVDFLFGQSRKVKETVVNPTFIEREDKRYSLHYALVPYRGYFHTVPFVPSKLQELGIEERALSQLVVSSEHFEMHPLLANSMQQFSLWLISSQTILKSFPISFHIQCSDAIQFCQQLKISPEYYQLSITKTQFDIIHSSNLMDSLSPPCIVLCALPLLSYTGYMVTTTKLYKQFASDIESYFQMLFGFEAELLPVICGIRCVGHEGKFADTVSIQPNPSTLQEIKTNVHYAKLLVWEKVKTLPLKLKRLTESSAVTQALAGSVRACCCSFRLTGGGLATKTALCTESFFLILQVFISSLDQEVAASDYHFWGGLCSLLQADTSLRPFLVHLQTQSLLHGIHFHLTVSPSSCPICLGKPVGDFACQVSLSFTTLLASRESPFFPVLVHKRPTIVLPEALHSVTTHPDLFIFDSAPGISYYGREVELCLIIPCYLLDSGYYFTIAKTKTCSMQIFGVATRQCVSDHVTTRCLTDFIPERLSWRFESQKQSQVSIHATLGAITCHFGDGNSFKTIVSLSSVVNRSSLGHEKVSPSALRITHGHQQLTIRYPYPINHCDASIALSEKTATISVARGTNFCYEERPMFITNADNRMLYSLMPVSRQVFKTCVGMQFTKEDRKILQKFKGYYSENEKPTSVNLKETVLLLLQCHEKKIAFVSGKTPLAIMVVNNHFVDIQSKVVAVDISYLFFPDHVFPPVVQQYFQKLSWTSGQFVIEINMLEFDALQLLLKHFSNRTVGVQGKSPKTFLAGSGVEHYFTRAVVYPLYADPEKAKDNSSPLEVVMELEVSLGSQQRRLYTSSEDEHSAACSNCGNRTRKLKKCSWCSLVWYCGEECQRKHRKFHKTICQATASTSKLEQQAETKVGDHKLKKATASQHQVPRTQTATNRCGNCGEGNSLKCCTGCMSVAYCSKYCQTKHWPMHRDVCIALRKNKKN